MGTISVPKLLTFVSKSNIFYNCTTVLFAVSLHWSYRPHPLPSNLDQHLFLPSPSLRLFYTLVIQLDFSVQVYTPPCGLLLPKWLLNICIYYSSVLWCKISGVYVYLCNIMYIWLHYNTEYFHCLINLCTCLSQLSLCPLNLW